MLIIFYKDGTKDTFYLKQKNDVFNEEQLEEQLYDALNSDSKYIYITDVGIHINKDVIKKIKVIKENKNGKK